MKSWSYGYRGALGALGFLIALSACNASGASTRPAAAPSPAATTACLHALDLADLLLNQAGQASSIDSQIFEGRVTATQSVRRLSDLTGAQAALQPKYERGQSRVPGVALTQERRDGQEPERDHHDPRGGADPTRSPRARGLGRRGVPVPEIGIERIDFVGSERPDGSRHAVSVERARRRRSVRRLDGVLRLAVLDRLARR